MPVTSWKGAAFRTKVEARVQRNLDRAALFLIADIKKSYGSPASMPSGWNRSGMVYKQWHFYDDKAKKGSGLYSVGKSSQWRMMQHSKPGEPPFVQTGALRRGTTWETGRTSLSRKVGVVKSVFYALWLELGTRAGGIIRPVTKKALYWPGAAHPVKSVQHKGMAARPYLRPALRRNKAKLLAMISGKA